MKKTDLNVPLTFMLPMSSGKQRHEILKLAPVRTDGRLFTAGVSAKFKVTSQKH